MKQKQIDDQLYSIIKEIHMNSESYSEDDVREILIENQYICSKLEEEALKENKCPKCYNKLVVKTIGQNTSEYQGFEASEPIYQLQCSDCGFVID